MPCFVKTKHLQDTLCNLLYLIELRWQLIIALMLSIPSDQGKYPAICRVYFINHILPYFMWLLCARLTPPVFWVCNFCNISLGKCSHQVKIKPTPPSEGLAMKPSDGMVTQSDHAIWGFHCQPLRCQGNLIKTIRTLRWHGHSEWPDSEWAHRVKINTKFWELSIHRPVTHFIPRPATQSDQTANELIKLKSIPFFFVFLGTFYSPSGHSFHSPSGHSEWPDSEWAHQAKINTIFFCVFGNFLFTTRSALSFPIRSLLSFPVRSLISFPVRSLLSFPVRSLISFPVRSLISFPVRSLLSFPVRSLLSFPVRSLLSFPIQSLMSLHCPVAHFIHCPVTHFSGHPALFWLFGSWQWL